jgi:hypothetical protein
MIFSIYTNVKNMINGEFKYYNSALSICCLLFLFHNIIGLLYMIYLLTNYLPLCFLNMHSLEWMQIKNLFETAQQNGIKCNFKYFYTRSNIIKNISEMMGSYNIVTWFIPYPYLYRQNLS